MDIKSIQKYYDLGHSVRETCSHFNMSSKTFYKLKIKTRSISEGNKLYSKKNPQKVSLETKEKLSKIRADALRDKAFYSKRSNYNGITLDSSYELLLAKDLDKNNVKWIRPKSLVYFDGVQNRRYIPDFYLPDYDVYLDPKNDFLIKKDRRKIKLTEECNDVSILILDKNSLTWESVIRLIKNKKGSETG